MKHLYTILLFAFSCLLTTAQTVIKIPGVKVVLSYAEPDQQIINRYSFASTGGKKSAAVYDANGILVRHLFSGKMLTAGEIITSWDRKNDAGSTVPDGNYTIKIITSNLLKEWEGVIGNTTNGQQGFFDVIHSMAFNGTYGYAAAGYQEQQPVAYKFPLNDPNNITAIGGKAATTKYVSADASHVYWASAEGTHHWVYATNVSNDQPYEPANGISVSVSNSPNCLGAIDVYHAQTGNANSNAYVTGLAVQQSGNYLFVSHAALNKVNVLNKTTGALVQALTVTNPRGLCIDDSDNLWMISDTNTVARYTVNSNGTLSSATLTLSGITTPVAISVKGTTALVSDLSTQQVRSFHSSTGMAGAVLGTSGGYATSPVVTNTKFYWKDPEHDYYGTFLAHQPDSTFWVGDGGQLNQHYGNCRYLKFAANFSYLDQVMYIPAFYSCVVDKNNPTRAFINYLEFNTNYSGLAKNNWALTNNWGYNVLLGKDDMFTRLRGLQTLSNGRTYGAAGIGNTEIVELVPNAGLRYTGVQFGINSQLYPDGNLYTLYDVATGQQSHWYRNLLTGFDGSNNPVYGDPTIVESTPATTNQDPVFTGNITTLSPGEKTSNNAFVSFDGNTPGGNNQYGNFAANDSPHYRGSGYHLGAVKNGQWLWKTALITHPGYTGNFPADGSYDIGNGVNSYSGSKALASDSLIVWGYHGEFYKGGQTNYWNIVTQDGLFVDQFGTLAQGQPVDGMAGNSFSATLVKVGNDLYLYHNDESYHSGLHRWKISNLNSIAVQTATPTNLPLPATGTNLMAGLPFNRVLANNTAGWTRSPTTDDYTNLFAQWLQIKTSVKTFDKSSGKDVNFWFRRNTAGSASVSRALGSNTGLSTYTISGVINFEGNNGDNDGNNYARFELLDNAGKTLLRINELRNLVSDGVFSRTMQVNNTTFISGLESEVYGRIVPPHEFTISVSGNNITFSWGNEETVIYTKFDNTSNLANPASIKLSGASTGSNYDRVIGVSDLEFMGGS